VSFELWPPPEKNEFFGFEIIFILHNNFIVNTSIIFMIKSSFIDIESCKIFVQQAGDPGKSAIVFIHGASISSEFWYKQFTDTSLADNYSLYAFDLPGHGQSGKAKDFNDYSLKGLGKMVNKIIKALDIDEYILVTLSIASNIIAETVENLQGCKGIFMTPATVAGVLMPVPSR